MNSIAQTNPQIAAVSRGSSEPAADHDVAIVVVSFNTRDLLRECLDNIRAELTASTYRGIVWVVDNASRDQSAEMVENDYPEVELIRSTINLGFAGANNQALERIVHEGAAEFVVLLNSDAFFQPGALRCAIERMRREPRVGLAGARLVGRDGSWQPSARLYPSPLNDLLTLSGLAARFPDSRFFGRFDQTWADPAQACDTDWVPGAFSIIRRETLESVGIFDEDFFLYYEEVDLCRRIKQAGWRIAYWPEVEVVHIGGESARTVHELDFAGAGSQLALWRMRSALLYYRKRHGPLTTWMAHRLERSWHTLRAWRNRRRSSDRGGAQKAAESSRLVELLDQAWQETDHGRISPPRPW